jgi:hypothetical protein
MTEKLWMVNRRFLHVACVTLKALFRKMFRSLPFSVMTLLWWADLTSFCFPSGHSHQSKCRNLTQPQGPELLSNRTRPLSSHFTWKMETARFSEISVNQFTNIQCHHTRMETRLVANYYESLKISIYKSTSVDQCSLKYMKCIKTT